MTAERIKEIQKATAYPESVSVQQALLQVWNECAQEASQQRTEGIKEGFEAAREYRFKHWDEFQRCLNYAMRDAHEHEEAIINRAMEIYAEMVLKSRKKKSKINPYEPTGFKAINSKTTKP